jgi:NAD(P)-dependent dehydrogenase (short-subunit alcohol dehydrogenase family)
MNEKGTQMSTDFEGKVAFVTGGAGGIGMACVRALRAAGAVVVVGDMDSAAAQEAVGAEGAVLHALDVTSPESVDGVIAAIERDHGRLDIAINCAGMRHARPAEELPDDEWERVFDVNTAGVFRSCRAEGALMLRTGGGSIVNIASMSGHVVNRPQKQAAYNASKAAVHMITKSLAVEWATRGIRVNSISPGYVITAMTYENRTHHPERVAEWMGYTPMERMADPEEIAGPAMFLSSPAASYITGADLRVDGGYTAV